MAERVYQQTSPSASRTAEVAALIIFLESMVYQGPCCGSRTEAVKTAIFVNETGLLPQQTADSKTKRECKS